MLQNVVFTKCKLYQSDWQYCLFTLFISLLIFCLIDLSITDRVEVEVFNYNCGFVYFSFYFCQFYLTLFDICCQVPTLLGMLHLLREFIPLSQCPLDYLFFFSFFLIYFFFNVHQCRNPNQSTPDVQGQVECGGLVQSMLDVQGQVAIHLCKSKDTVIVLYTLHRPTFL